MKTANNPTPTPQKKTIAILQLTRFGDLIQTAQALAEFKTLHSEYRIVLIARSQFAQPLGYYLKTIFDEIYVLNTGRIFDQKETKGLKNAANELNSFLNNVSQENIEVLVNLSFSKSSNYLASIINSAHKIGPYYDLNNKLIITDKWSQMLYSTVMRGSLNPFSLVDIFKNIVGIKDSKKPKLNIVNHDKKNNIVIHPFASQERKTWKPEKWVEIIYKTLKENDNVQVTLVGAKNEFVKSQLIAENPLLKSFSNRIINLTGRTSIEELQNEVLASKLFLGHDSMVGHLASVTGTTSLTISLGNVRPWETTPYQSNAYNLSPRTKCFPCFPTDKCSYYQCHHDIPYQVVSTIIKQLLSQKELTTNWVKENISSFHLSSINLHKANISSGRMKLNNLIDGHQDTNEIYRNLYRVNWQFILSNQDENINFPKLNNTTHQDLLNGLTGLQHLYELSEFGKKYSRYILEEIASSSPSILKIKEFSKKIDEIDELQKMVQRTAPQLAPIIDYFTMRKGNLFGDNIVKLTESSYTAFEEYGDMCRIMYELIESTISEHKNNRNSNLRTETNR